MKDIEYLKQKREVVKEFGDNHSKRSAFFMLIPIVFGMLSTGLLQVLYSKNIYKYWNMSQEEVQSYSFFEFENCMIIFGIIVSMILYVFSIKWYLNKIYYMFRDEYRIVFISGLRDDELVQRLATYQMPILVLSAGLGMIIVPQICLGYFDLVNFNWLALVLIVILTYISMRDVYRQHFYVITGLHNRDYEMSVIDGSCKLVSYLTVEENISLPNRILRGEEKKDALCTAYEQLMELGLDDFKNMSITDMSPVQRMQIMIARAYSVAGSELKFDENMLQNLTDSERRVIELLLERIKNSNKKYQ